MERYKGTFDTSFGIEFKMRKEQQLNKEGEARFDTDAAPIIEDNARSGDFWHTSGGVFVAVDIALEVVVDRRRSRWVLSLGSQEESSKVGCTSEEVCGVLPCAFGFQKDRHRGLWR